MFTLIKRFTREDISTPFFGEYELPTKEYLMQVRTQYIETNKILKSTTEFSLDKKTMITTTVWKTSDDFLNFIMDASYIATYLRKNHIYNLKNNIKTETSCIGK
jgi:hypothetical protein